MTTIFERLSAHTGALRPAAGTTKEQLLAEVRGKIAAVLILEDPSLLPIPSDPSVDPLLHKAAVEGEKLAKKWKDEGARRRFVQEEYLTADSGAQLPVETLGPFVGEDLVLLQFDFYDALQFFRLVLTENVGGATVQRVVALLPKETKADPQDSTRWVVPEGTVWIRATELRGGVDGWVGLRVDSGKLEIDEGAEEPDGVVVPVDKKWKLAVAPKAPAPASVDGSDADGVNLTLPTELQIGRGLNPTVKGPIAMSGFGDALQFTFASGPIAETENALLIPFTKPNATWHIENNRSKLFTLKLKQPTAVSAPAWALPLSSTPFDQLGQARHGGSLVLQVAGGLRSQVTGTTRGSTWQETTMTVNADGIEMRAAKAAADITLQLSLWRRSRTTVKVTHPHDNVTVRHASRRRGADLVAFTRGRVINGWDLPRSASGAPFEFDGALDLLSLIREHERLWRTTVHGSRQPDADKVVGYALENFYLHVRPPAATALAGSGSTPTRLDEGQARLLFDVGLAQPMLADPYAANWSADALGETEVKVALSARVSWGDGKTEVHSQVREPVAHPFPSLARDVITDDLLLLDVSGRQDQLGVGLSPRRDKVPAIDGNELVWPLNDTRLLMAPQVLWEPVHVVANVSTGDIAEVVTSKTQGLPTMAGVLMDSVELVPVRPRRVASDIVAAALSSRWWAVLFGLPFGMGAIVARQRAEREQRDSPLDVLLHRLEFTKLGNAPAFVSAAQLRLLATGVGLPGGDADPSRAMPGFMTQIANLEDNANILRSVLSNDVMGQVNREFQDKVPLHHVDLSGYGLSTFSNWRKATPQGAEDPTGVTQVRFDVLVGRTSYEVIQLHSRLWHPQARVVRTVIIERGNSGNVYRYDTGWVAVSNGDCQRYARIATGVVNEYRNIRNIRIVPKPLIEVQPPGNPGNPPLPVWKWQEVLYDADLIMIPDPAVAPSGQSVPIRNHTGYILSSPMEETPKAKQFAELMDELNRTIGGPLDASVRLGGTLAMQLSHLGVALASPATDEKPKFVLAVSGAPLLPRAGQWTAVAIEPSTDVTSVDPRLGVPVIKRENENEFVFRDPATAYDAGAREYGLLLATPAARVLFPGARVNPDTRGVLDTAKPYVADPSALALASSVFPRLGLTLKCAEQAQFTIADDVWKIKQSEFSFDAAASSLAAGGGWEINRDFPGAKQLTIDIDSATGAAENYVLGLKEPDALRLNIAPFGEVVVIRSAFKAASSAVAGFEKPSIDFVDGALGDLKEILDSLKHFVKLGFNVDVDVSAGNGPVPSFLVQLAMRLRLPERTNERIDIGLGKLRGKFEVTGRLHASPSGATSGQLAIELSGDLQQAIIPPVLYAGGQFRFIVQITDEGKPVIELGFGTVASIGGALIPGLLELEATVRYGYTLVPETLKPGVMLGIEARAKLLEGLIGFSFSADALAQIERFDDENVTVWCQLRVTATVQIAVLIEEEIDLQTQFQQKIPLEAVGLLAGPLPLAAASAVLRS